MKNLSYEIREFSFKIPPTNDELDTLIKKMEKQGYFYEGINPNNGNYAFLKIGKVGNNNG